MELSQPTRIHYNHIRILPPVEVEEKESVIGTRILDDIDIANGGTYRYTYQDFETGTPVLKLGTTDRESFRRIALFFPPKLFDLEWLIKEQGKMSQDPSGELHGLQIEIYHEGEKAPQTCQFVWDMGKDLSHLPAPFLTLLTGISGPLRAIKMHSSLQEK